MTLSITSREAPTEGALPIAALASQLRLPEGWETVPGQFARLAGRLRAALETVERVTGHALLERRIDLTGRAPGGRLLVVPISPIRSAVILEADGVVINLAGAVIESDGPTSRLCLARALRAGAAIRLTVIAGTGEWDSLPASLSEAVLLKAEALDGGGAPELDAIAARMMASQRHLRLGRG